MALDAEVYYAKTICGQKTINFLRPIIFNSLGFYVQL